MKPSARRGFRSSRLLRAFCSSRSALATAATASSSLSRPLPSWVSLSSRSLRSTLRRAADQVLLVLDALQLQVLLRLRHLGLGLLQQGLVAPDVLLEGRGVEEDEQVALLDHLAFGGEGDDLGLVALDGRGVGHGAQGLQGAALDDRDLERALLDGGGGDAGRARRRRRRAARGGTPRLPGRPGSRRRAADGAGPPRQAPSQVGPRPGLAVEPGPRVVHGLAGRRHHLRAGAQGQAAQALGGEGRGAHGVASRRTRASRPGGARAGGAGGASEGATSSSPVTRLSSARATW